MAGVVKRFDDVGADLSAARSQAWPDCGHEILRQRPERRLHGLHRRDRSALDGPSPASVCGADHAPAPIGDQHRCAIRDAHGYRGGPIVADDHVSFRPCPGILSPVAGDGGRRTVHLPNQQHLVEGDAHLLRHCLPFASIVTKFEIAYAEKVIRDFEQRTAAQNRSPGRLRPFETIVRLGLRHEYPRAWI